MSEQAIQSKIIKYLESLGAYVVKIQSASKKGVPDILACLNGKFIGCEVKRPETIKNTSKLQEYNLEQISKAAGISMVACSVDDVKQVLNTRFYTTRKEDG